MEINPRVVFERMFGGDARHRPSGARACDGTRSILDAVLRERATTCSAASGRGIARKLTEYMDNVARDRAAHPAGRAAARPRPASMRRPTPIGVPESWEEHVKLMFELMALAYQGQPDARDLVHDGARARARSATRRSAWPTGITRSRTTTASRSRSPRRPRSTSITSISSRSSWIELQATPDGDGNLLDHSLFLYGSGMSNGNQHTHDNLPMLLAGGARRHA